MALHHLIKYLTSPGKNVSVHLEPEDHKKIVDDVIKGYKIDDESRSQWLKVNQEALKMINGEELLNEEVKDFPFQDSSKVIYPLIQNATIQLASQLTMHVVRNDRVAECAVLGKDHQRTIPNPDFRGPADQVNQGNNPVQVNPQNISSAGLQASNPYMLEWVKSAKAKRVSDFMSYELLIESDSWLEDEHRLNNIVASWGTGFKQVYYDPNTNKACSELLSPEDVIINNNLFGALDKCRRYTIRQYLTKNEIVEKIHADYFLDIEFQDIQSNLMDNKAHENAQDELNPVVECLRQFCYLDLDKDGYEEPYFVQIALHKRALLGIYPAFEIENIKFVTNKDDPDYGKILSISPTMDLVDRHLISSFDGKYYSYGLNHLLFHQNRSITSILRQLIDAGSLRNAAGTTGLVAKSLKTRERTVRIKMGEFVPVDLPPDGDIDRMIKNLPITEPSQVLLQLLEVLVTTAKESGFITDILTGQSQVQNVPATTMLSQVEQGTRAFKPVVQKLFRSLKREFKLRFNLYSMYLDVEKYFKFQDQAISVTKDDFDDSLDVVPVADPTMSSEAHRFARLQAMKDWAMNVPGSTNIQEATLRYYTDLQFPNPEALVIPPGPPPPDPKLLQVQLDMQLEPMRLEIEKMKAQIDLYKVQLEARKVGIKEEDLQLKAGEKSAKIAKSIVDAHSDMMDIVNDEKLTKIEAYNAETERKRVEILDREPRKPESSK